MSESTSSGLQPSNVNKKNVSGNEAQKGVDNFFDIKQFDGFVCKQGYPVLIERAVKCPCRTRGQGSPLSDCHNCGGSGWTYIDQKKTTMVLQSMSSNIEQKIWTEADRGIVKVTALSDQKLCYYDKITTLSTETEYTEVLYPMNFGRKAWAFSIYKINEILDIFQFERSDLPLKELKEGDDYTFEKGTNKIVFSDSIFNQVLQGDNPRISIRYKHYGEFLIVDLVRDIVQFSQRKGRNEMNEHAIAKRLHYNFPGNDASISNFQ